MTDAERPDSPAPDAARQEKLDELMEKDAKSGRELKSWWYILTSALGIFMVLSYMYNRTMVQLLRDRSQKSKYKNSNVQNYTKWSAGVME